ncbi:response regulator [Mucilaginibacter sp.]|uniref:response regulator transcription factor n=1 Tax=Mucilaginibacter sp. TaxID=1882438 RepID=UPI002606C518|nr:response regulator [Mucilaginibacter sp.]MDB4922990.1 response regulator receiver [Mucilaginibacter sp.]
METIMVQERDAATLEVLTAALQMEGFRVCSLTDYSENALVMIRRHRPELILLDCPFNNQSGKQICQWIKSHFPGLPVIALSCDNHIDAHYRELGFNDYLKKPFDLDQLYQVVRKQLTGDKRKKKYTELTL